MWPALLSFSVATPWNHSELLQINFFFLEIHFNIILPQRMSQTAWQFKVNAVVAVSWVSLAVYAGCRRLPGSSSRCIFSSQIPLFL